MCETIALDPTKYWKKKKVTKNKVVEDGKLQLLSARSWVYSSPSMWLMQEWGRAEAPLGTQNLGSEGGKWGGNWYDFRNPLSAPSCKGMWRLFVDSEHQQLKAHLGSIPNTHLFFHMSISSITVPRSQPRAVLPTGALCLQWGIGAQLCFVPQLLSLCSLGMGPAVWWDPGGQRNENRGRASGGTDHLCLQPWAISPSPCAEFRNAWILLIALWTLQATFPITSCHILLQ